MQAKQLVHELADGLIGWYPFHKGSRLLFVSDGSKVFETWVYILKEKELNVQVITLKQLEEQIYEEGKFCYDYIVMPIVLEYSRNPAELLKRLRKVLKNNGSLLVVVNNRLAIRGFCGDKDIYTGHVFDGIDNYAKVSVKRRETIKGRAYSKAELKEMFQAAGFEKQKFYSVMPSILRPQILISENYIPNEVLDIRIFPQYQSPQTVFLEEEKLYDDLLKNGMFHPMANGFFIECSNEGKLSDADQITISGDRGRRHSLTTIVRYGKSVSKKALYKEGRGKIGELLENTEYLKKHQVPMIEANAEEDVFETPYIEGKLATQYLRETLREDKEKFWEELGRFKDIILASSEHVSYSDINWQKFDPEWEKRKADDPNIDKWEKLAFGSLKEQSDIGVILKRGYIDLVSLNCFHTDDGFVFFDQEFYVENLPANVIFIRTIDLIYRECPDLEQILSREEVLRFFRLWEHQDTWRKFTSVFMERLRNERELAGYHKQRRRDNHTIISNRHRMDYTQEEYDRLFNNIFKDIGNKKVYLFGSGEYAKQFLEQFNSYFEIAGILDNDCEKWGSELEGIPIMSLEQLKQITVPCKVFICIKFFEDVLTQLKSTGIRDISIYDPRLDYERPIRMAVRDDKAMVENAASKKYHVGYVAGVFDLFHVGHLNLLRRAKEQCDYLIVGIVSDEQVIKNKKTMPYIPFEERRAIVEACRYVDEAVAIPINKPNTEDAWRMYHFDVQFSGSDYEDDPIWMAKREFLKQHGAELVFFPYTKSTNSTKIKAEIRNTSK